MKKITLLLAFVFSVGTFTAFALPQTDKDKEREKKEAKEKLLMKLAPGKSCAKGEHKEEKEEKKADKKQ